MNLEKRESFAICRLLILYGNELDRAYLKFALTVKKYIFYFHKINAQKIKEYI